MDPMARRRSLRQDPDAADDELEKAMQAMDGQSRIPAKGASSAAKGKKASKKSKEGDVQENKTGSPKPVAPEAKEASGSEGAAPPASSEGIQDAVSEDLRSPDSVATHPFWSDKAKLEIALAKARPSDLDSEALRFAEELGGKERPADLEERRQIKQEVRLDEEFLEPPYDSPLRESTSKDMGSPCTGSLQKSETEEGKPVHSDRVPQVVHRVEPAVIPEGVHSLQGDSRVGEQLEDQALEIAQLRSLVDHLQGALQQVEESRSFTSSSNQGFEPQSAISLAQGVAKTRGDTRRFELSHEEELTLLRMSQVSNSPRPPVGPVSGPWPPIMPPLPPANPVPPTLGISPPNPPVPAPMLMPVNQGKLIPEVYRMSSKATGDPFQGTVLVHGQPHRWIKIGDQLGLEPLDIPSRERSPSPPPPKSTPPPSPPPCLSSSEGWMMPRPAPREPSSQALVLYSDGQDLSSHALGDQDGSGSGVHSCQSAESGGGKTSIEAYPQSCVTHALSPRVTVGPDLSGGESSKVDTQSLLYHLGQIKRGQLTLDQLASAIGAQHASGMPGQGAQHGSGMSGQGAQHALGMPGQGAQHALGMPGQGAQHALGMPGQGAQHASGMPGQGAQHASGMPGQGAQHVSGMLGQGAQHMSSVPDQSVSPLSGKLNQDSLSIHHSGRTNSGMEVSGRHDSVDWLRERGLGLGAERSHLQGLSASHAQAQGSGMMHPGMHDAGAEQVGVQGLGAKQIEAQGLGAASTFVSSAPRSLSDMNHSTNVPGRGLSGAHSGCPGSQAANVHGAAHMGLGFTSSGTPQGVGLAAQAPTMFADPVAPGHSSVGAPLNPADPPNEGRDATWFGNTATPRGRGEFEPGDTVFWELPKLGSVSEPNAAVRASDWLYRSALMLRDLSSKSWQWWDRVYEAALRHYDDYQQADPLSRGLLRADLPEDLRHHTFARLESRAVSMILHAVPESIASQAMATRSLSTVGLLFQILKQYQPKVLGERQELLKSLTDLSPASHAGDAVLVLQAWFRHVARARTMQVQLPDGSLLLAALDTMAKPLLADNSQLAFRVSLNRHQLRLDYRAELELVEAYARNLMAEFELLSLASDSPSSPKKPRVKKAKEKASAPVPPAKESAAAPIPPASSPPPPKPPAKAPMSSKVCTSWLTDAGCKYGSKCRFVHDMETEALKGRCFACSAKDHWANNCPVKQAERQGDSPPGKAKGHSARKGEGKGKASVGLKALDSGLPSAVETPGVGSAESSAPNNKTMILETENPATELAPEVTEVLRSLRLKKIGSVRAESEEYRIQSLPEPQAVLSYGLVDSGATTAVRTGHSHELQEALPVTAQLALGEAAMSANKYGTLLSPVLSPCPLWQPLVV